MAITPQTNKEPTARNDQAMRYRPLGSTGLMVSALSMGCMRLTEDQAKNDKLIGKCLDLGANYFETTRFYCGGKCQHRTAPGLKDRVRGIIVSGKGGTAPDTSAHMFLKEIERQLEILRLTHFKFYQLGWYEWGRMVHLFKLGGVFEAMRQAQNSGLVHHFGLTGHDSPENFTRCIETGIFDSITVPYNLLYRGYEPTIKRAGELGVGVVAMCPVGGGSLAYESAPLREATKMDMPTAEMSLRFVLSNPDVSTACSGMMEPEHIEQNARTVRDFDPETQGIHDVVCEGVDRLRQTLGEKICTACGYCMPCPEGVDIPLHMGLFRNWKVLELDAESKDWPGSWVSNAIHTVPTEQRVTKCNKCGKCEERCPNELDVRDTLAQLAELFSK